MSDTNPLIKHFRQPKIYIQLPSRGQWYPDDIKESLVKEIQVLPMTAKDEITIKTPDALLNGYSTVSVVASCFPNIKDPWEMPVVDVDFCLIALRLASYGELMDISTKCPHCSHFNDHQLDLRVVLDNYVCPDYSDPIVTEENLVIKFRPGTYRQFNESLMKNFEEQRLAAAVNNVDTPEEVKIKTFSEVFEKLSWLTVRSIASNIDSITTETGDKVTNQEHIGAFVVNCDSKTYNLIKNKVDNLREQSNIKPFKVNCGDCEKEYDIPFTFDYSNFFA
jgi:T4 bacteriophage base plate protein